MALQPTAETAASVSSLQFLLAFSEAAESKSFRYFGRVVKDPAPWNLITRPLPFGPSVEGLTNFLLKAQVVNILSSVGQEVK